MKSTPSVLYSIYPPFAFFRATYIMVVSFTLDDPLSYHALYWATPFARELIFMSVVATVDTRSAKDELAAARAPARR